MMRGESLLAKGMRAKLRIGTACCLCVLMVGTVAGCSKESQQGQEGAGQPSEAAGITGSAEPTGSGASTGEPKPTGAADNGDSDDGGKTDGSGENSDGSGKGDGSGENPDGSGKPDASGENPGGGDAETMGSLILSGTADEILACFRKQSYGHTLAMLSEDFSVCSAFSPELSGQLSERDMKSAWKQAVSGLGKPLDQNGQEVNEPQEAAVIVESSFLNPPASGSESGSIADFGGYVITSAQIPYGTKNVIISITYGQTGAVEGIYLTYTLPPVQAETTENYTEREVGVGEGGYSLSGILTLPNGVEKPPVVLLVQGSGQSDKNETIGAAGNAPFADIAHGLAERGIATLRYDKRYYAYPELATDTVTIRDEVLDDVALALALLKETPEVDEGRIFVLGHSLGGMLAPCIAKENPEVAGIISMAGSPRGLWEIVYDQNMAVIQAVELSEAELLALGEMVQQEYDKVLSLVADVRDAELEPQEEVLSEVLFGVTGYYWASLAEIDTAAIAEGISVPMLILQGDADFQVYPERDFAAWQVLLEGRENITFHLFEGLNHLFMPSNGAMDLTEYDEEGHVSQEVIETVATWLLR